MTNEPHSNAMPSQTAHYAFAHMLRGLAAVFVLLGAHLMNIFWFKQVHALKLLGFEHLPGEITTPAVVQGFQWLAHGFDFGHFGVALFFLISGFVIPFSLLNLRPKSFLISRFFRIYPTYWAAFSCSLLVIYVLHQGHLWFGVHQIVIQMALIRELFWVPTLDGISWTLEIEVLFYLICALTSELIIQARFKAILKLILLITLAAPVLASLHYGAPSLSHWQIHEPWFGFAHGFALVFLFIPYLFIGTYFNWHVRGLLSTLTLICLVCANFCCFALIWYYSDLKPNVFNGVFHYLLALFGFSLCYAYRNQIRVPRFLTWLGNISYPLYAVHLVVGYGLLFWLLQVKTLTATDALLISISTVVGLAVILHHLIELPSNRFGKLLAKGLTFKMKNYVVGIWAARYFWFHLALSDLRSKWRRSFVGVFWSILQPLGMTALLSLVFSRLFHMSVMSYAPYILSGIIAWEFIGSSLTGGSLAFVQADAYIKQCKHPLAIYTLRLILGNLIVFTLASTVLWIWALIALPQNIGWHWLAIFTFFPLVVLIAWPMSTLLAYWGTRFRDIPYAMGLILQVVWFVSPVYFDAQMFRNGGLGALVDYNPIYHLLQIIRAPILEGHWPTFENYFVCLLAAFVFTIAAILVGRKAERSVIFYL